MIQLKRQRTLILRTLAVLLCFGLLFGALSPRLLALQEEIAVPQPSAALMVDRYELLLQAPLLYYNTYVGFLSFLYDGNKNFFYVADFPWQHAFGYNKSYDDLAWIANCYVDTIRCKFRYGDKDWLVQLWKGGYGVFIFTGGEVGLYNKPIDRSAEHYDSAAMEDWIGMELIVYENDKKLFERPMHAAWWVTGFAWGTVDSLYQKPRPSCVLEAQLLFQDAEMAALFAGQLAEKGFTKQDKVDQYTPESYALKGNAVHLVWRNVTETWY
jgi:hypothetical protein